MDTTAQKRAIERYRARLAQRGIARFEVAAPETDRDLIKTLARRLSEDSADAETIRSAVQAAIAPVPRKGGIVAALRRSPLVGAELHIERDNDDRRPVEL